MQKLKEESIKVFSDKAIYMGKDCCLYQESFLVTRSKAFLGCCEQMCECQQYTNIEYS